MTKKKKAKKAEIPANTERAFGPIVMRLRVEDEAKATQLVEAGARCVRQDLDGYHLELDEEARQACGV